MASKYRSRTRTWYSSNWYLSKAFDCLPHDWFIAKLFAYGLDDKALRFIYDYLRHRNQRTKIADSYSWLQEILYCVPQR